MKDKPICYFVFSLAHVDTHDLYFVQRTSGLRINVAIYFCTIEKYFLMHEVDDSVEIHHSHCRWEFKQLPSCRQRYFYYSQWHVQWPIVHTNEMCNHSIDVERKCYVCVFPLSCSLIGIILTISPTNLRIKLKKKIVDKWVFFFFHFFCSGLDVVALLDKIGMTNSMVSTNIATGASTFVIAYAVHKLFAPVRISITLVSAPLIVRYLRKKGILKAPKNHK